MSDTPPITTEKPTYATGLTCLACGEQYSFEQIKAEQGTTMVNICYNACMGPLDLTYDYDAVKKILTPTEIASRPETFWRLRELLPVGEIKIPDRPYTPLVKAKRLGAELGIELYFKLDLDEINPTCSFKDRPVTLAFNKAIEQGYDTVYVASTGNLAISTARFARENQIKAKIYIPASLGDVKKNAIREQMGNDAELLELDQSYDDCNVQSMHDCQQENEKAVLAGKSRHCFVPNNSFRPYYKEGSKTSGWEIAFQIAKEITPDREINIVYPVGSGALLCAANKGIEELKKLGLWQNPHRMWATQAANVAPVVNAWTQHQAGKAIKDVRIEPVLNPQEKTVARSIAIGQPGSGYQTLEVLKKSSGGGWTVSERELFEATLELIEKENFFPQFVGGTVLAGIRKGVESGELARNSVVVANLTGLGRGRIEDDLIKTAEQFGKSDTVKSLLSE